MQSSAEKDKVNPVRVPKEKDSNGVKIMTLNPGHFHSALVQKTMYEQVSPTVHVYAPAGPDVKNHLKMIEQFNTRTEDPTNWREKVYTGDDFLEKMLKEKPGNIVVLAGNNKKKTSHIKACVDAGLNVLSDKPMCIDAAGFKLLKKAFASAEKNNVLLYDIMTERSSITTILQKELLHNRSVFGELVNGSVDEPAVVKESVHHFFKYVAGKPLTRPGWYFDTTQQGEGLADITTHLVDIVMWMLFPEKIIDYQNDIEIKKAKRWPTMITKQQYEKVTKLSDFPVFLKDNLNDEGVLPCYANGEMIYTLKGIHTKLSVIWNFEALAGGKDTHYSLVRGTKANVIIRQGKEQNYRPELYVEPTAGANKDKLSAALKKAVAELQTKYPGLELKENAAGWQILVPDKYRIGHEAHFRQVMVRYLKYLADGKLPNWEVPNMLTKYYTTTKALELATVKKKHKPTVEFVKAEDKIDCLIDGRHFTSYRYGDGLGKPILFPLNSPSGAMINRGWPLLQIEGENTEHPHHKGLWFAYRDVNGDDFWLDPASPAHIKHAEVTEMTGGTGKGTLATVSHWLDKNGKTLLKENRKMVFYGRENEYAIDFDIDLTAQDTKVVFGDHKDGLFAFQAAGWLSETGTGRFLNSNGDEGEKNTWGKRAQWVRLQGRKDGKTIGIAILNHPSSVNYPAYWHTRGYGLITANPLGQLIFQQNTGQLNPQPFNLTLQPNESAHFGFRVLIYEGNKTGEQLQQQFEKYIN